jgi:hypothetical protein
MWSNTIKYGSPQNPKINPSIFENDVIFWNYCHGPKPNNNLLSFALSFYVKQKVKLPKVIGQWNPKGAKKTSNNRKESWLLICVRYKRAPVVK